MTRENRVIDFRASADSVADRTLRIDTASALEGRERILHKGRILLGMVERGEADLDVAGDYARDALRRLEQLDTNLRCIIAVRMDRIQRGVTETRGSMSLDAKGNRCG